MDRRLTVVCLATVLAMAIGCAKSESATVAPAPSVDAGQARAALGLDENRQPLADLASVPRIGVKDLKAAMDSGTVVVIDVRNESGWKSSHIPGAIHVPGAEIPSRLAELPRDRMLVTYCT